MSFWPATPERLRERGYRFSGSGRCSSASCSQKIYWVETPKGKKMPLELTAERLWISHYASCPAAAHFRQQHKEKQSNGKANKHRESAPQLTFKPCMSAAGLQADD